MLLCIMLSNINQFRAEIPRYYHDVDTSYLMTSYTLLQQFYQDFLTAIMSRVVLVSVENVANIWMLKHILQVLSALSYSSSLPQLLVKQETTTLPPQPFKVRSSIIVLLPSKLTVQGKRIDFSVCIRSLETTWCCTWSVCWVWRRCWWSDQRKLRISWPQLPVETGGQNSVLTWFIHY